MVSEGSSDKAKDTIENEKQVGWCDPVPGLLVFLLCGFSARRQRVINPAASFPPPQSCQELPPVTETLYLLRGGLLLLFTGCCCHVGKGQCGHTSPCLKTGFGRYPESEFDFRILYLIIFLASETTPGSHNDKTPHTSTSPMPFDLTTLVSQMMTGQVFK